jgi:hypothetical protein
MVIDPFVGPALIGQQNGSAKAKAFDYAQQNVNSGGLL